MRINMMNKLKFYLLLFYGKVSDQYKSHFGFDFCNTTFNNIVNYLYSPRDASSLAVTRILFGLCMLLDVTDERGGAIMDKRWGDPSICHFPLLPFVTAMPMPYMAIVYVCLWFGALGIMLGFKYRTSASAFAVSYWYLFLIEKSFWNNHSYLFGLVALLMVGTDADCFWSIDAFKYPSKKRSTVPYWNYFILKYQFFILYFVAGLKKGTAEWLTGYSLLRLAEHWVFDPFKIFLTVAQIDYLIVHWFAFVFDLTIAFWMMWQKTRHVAMVFCAAFHLMNIRLFRIGMFPWVCLATMPLFYPCDWPKRLTKLFCKTILRRSENEMNRTEEKNKVTGNKDENVDTKEKITEDKSLKQMLTVCAIFLYMAVQAFLPYSHFITKGYNDWTNGLYGYSWDMMVHSWVPHSVVVKIVDNQSKKDIYLDPFKLTPNERWISKGNMIYQFANCINETINNNANGELKNVSIYLENWCSMNGRFQQRMYDSKRDLLKAEWYPFEKISWLMPLLDETTSWRSRSVEIEQDVYKWNNHTNVIFIADFPGYSKENYLEPDMINITLTVLEGQVAYEPEMTNNFIGQSYRLHKGEHMRIPSGFFHVVTTLGDQPAFYMYTYVNETEILKPENNPEKPKLPLAVELAWRIKKMITFFEIVNRSLIQLFFRMWL